MTRIAALALATAILALSCASAPKAADSPSSPAAAAAAPAAAVPAAPAAEPPATAEAASSTPAAGPAAAAVDPELAALYSGASEASLAAISEANGLVQAGKYKSAFDGLALADPDNADPYILAAKARLALSGAVRTDLHRAFAFADLEDGMSVEEARNTEGDYETVPFDPPALAEAQAMNGIEIPGILAQILGEYYYDILIQYEGQWLLPDEEVLAMCADYLDLAFAASSFDSASLKVHADVLSKAGRAADADPVLREAIALDPADPALRFNLGVSLLAREMKPEALAAFDEAIEAYGEDPERFNSIALAARTAGELGDEALLEKYLASADAVYEGASPMPALLRHYIAIERADDEAAAAAADSLMGEYGGDPNVVRSLVGAWFAAGRSDAALSFLERNIAVATDDLTLGALNFYLAVLLVQDEQIGEEAKQKALGALDAAEASMTRALEPDNGVFQAIAEIRAALTGEYPDFALPPEEGAETPAEAAPGAAPAAP